MICFKFQLFRSSRGFTHSFSKICTHSPSVESSIKEKLQKELNPVYLKVQNESPMHHVPKQSETHFRIIVVSEKFKDLSVLQRHKTVNKILVYELNNGIHALSMETLTPEQWKKTLSPQESPDCVGDHL